MDKLEFFSSLKDELSNAPKEVKESFNEVVKYFDKGTKKKSNYSKNEIDYGVAGVNAKDWSSKGYFIIDDLERFIHGDSKGDLETALIFKDDKAEKFLLNWKPKFMIPVGEESAFMYGKVDYEILDHVVNVKRKADVRGFSDINISEIKVLGKKCLLINQSHFLIDYSKLLINNESDAKLLGSEIMKADQKYQRSGGKR